MVLMAVLKAARAFSNCGGWHYCLVLEQGLLSPVATLVTEHGFGLRSFSSCSCRERAPALPGFSNPCSGAQQLWPAGSGAQAQQLCHTSLAPLRHVGSSQTRDPTPAPCIDWQILYQESLVFSNALLTFCVPLFFFQVQ